MINKINKVKSTNDLELQDRLVAINRVTKVTKGGRAFSFAAIVVVGNEDGVIGWGLGKANEVTAAIAKGVETAKKNARPPLVTFVTRLMATRRSFNSKSFVDLTLLFLFAMILI